MGRRALWLLAAVLLTVSCSDGQKGAAPPPPPAAATATPSAAASPTPFVSPADKDGAFAFVRAYFDAVNRAVATGEVAPLAPYRDPSCSCLAAEKDITRVYSSGGHV